MDSTSAKRPLSNARRKGLAPALRPEFDARALAGEDVRTLARAFGLEPWYAARRVERVLAAGTRTPSPERRVATHDLLETLGPIQAAIVILDCPVQPARGGTYVLRGFRVGPRDVVRAANEKLLAMGEALIPYPGVAPYQQQAR